MFDELFEVPAIIKRYQTGPLVEARARYLCHLRELGTCRGTLRKCANDQLHLVGLLDLQEGDRVSIARIEAAAAIWALPEGRNCMRAATPKARKRFVSAGIQWLRFLGWLDEAECSRHRYHAEVRLFEEWLCTERGLSGATIRSYCDAADRFFLWLSECALALCAVRNIDIDDAISAEHRRGTWNRRTLHAYAERLKAFFLFAEARGWCTPGLASGIIPPRFMAEENVPKGLRREDVLRLLASVDGERPLDKRDRAILMLFVTYGLRVGEVAGLQLDDLDWEKGVLRVRCTKPGRIHLWPLSQEVGHAILRYIREARPSGFGRNLFFTTYAPIRPLSSATLSWMVRERLARIGIASGRRGAHALRHTVAQHLLEQGMSMKVIGDFLGHSSLSSTAIYAKVNLAALREVAAIELEDLV